MANELSVIVRVKNMASQGLNSVIGSVKNLGSSISGGIGGALGSLKGMVVGLAGAGSAAGLFVQAIKKSFEFERYQNQFGILFGSMEKAKTHFKELKQFADATPFELAGIAQASRTMLSMSGGVLGYADSLKQVGDAAAAAGQPIQEVGMWTARAYGAIRNGQPFGEAAMRLQEMGILGGEARKKMEDLQAAGATNAEIWGVFTAELEKSKGGMEKLSTTGEGLMSTLGDTWDGALAKFGDRFQDLAKDKIKGLIDWITKLTTDGTIDVWANRTVKALETVKDVLSGLGEGLKILYKFSGLSDAMAFVKGGAMVAGTIAGGGSFKDAMGAGGQGLATGFYGEKIFAAMGATGFAEKNKAEEEATARQEQKIRENAKKQSSSKVEADKQSAAKLAESAKRQADDLAKGQILADQKAFAEIGKAYKDAKKGLVKEERDASELGMGAFTFDQGTVGRDKTEKAGKERLKDELGQWKDRLSLKKEAANVDKGMQKELFDKETKRFEQEAVKAGERNARFLDNSEKAKADRQMTSEERQEKKILAGKKARSHSYSEEELATMRARQAVIEKKGEEQANLDGVLSLNKEEKEALAEDKKFMDKADKLRARAKSGQKLSEYEKRVLAEADAATGARQAKDAKEIADKNADERRKTLEEQAFKDLSEVRKKLDSLLTMKEGG